MLFELRQYRTLPGQRENWVRCMETEIIPLQVAKGMVIVGSFVGESEADQDLYVWIRRFNDEEHRKACYAAVYESDTWKNDIAPKIPSMMDREKMVITRLLPTPASVLR